MKYLFVALISFAFLAIASSVFSQSNSELIVGVWRAEKVDFTNAFDELSEEDKSLFLVFQPMLEEILLTMEIVCLSDGIMNTKVSFMAGDKIDMGRWEFSDDEMILKHVQEDGYDEFYIQKLTKTEFVYTTNIDGAKPVVYMKRIQ